MSVLPSRITNEEMLDDMLTQPSPELIDFMQQLSGDLVILGIAGKMGVTMGQLAVRAARMAGRSTRVFGVSRFSEPTQRAVLDAAGIETIACDLLDATAVQQLPHVPHVIYLAGRKFGTNGDEPLTWAMNTLAAAHVARHFAGSRIVAFSTGCVYPLVAPVTGGCTERDQPAPVGEYAQSCLGRERIFEHFSRTTETPVCLIRLNYANDLRYGVLHDLAQCIWRDEPVDLTVGQVNVIWQGDANAMALRALDACAVPAVPLNITGPETVSVRWAALRLGALLGKTVTFTGNEGGVAYLNNAARAIQLFGYPRVSLEQMLCWTADWVMSGGRSLNKRTHFEVNTGRF